MNDPNDRDVGSSTMGRRIGALRILSLVLFLVFSTYLFSLQVLRGGEYRSRATDIARQSTVISAQRGEIYARDFTLPLVLNTDSFAVSIVPARLPPQRRNEVFAKLANTLGISAEDIRKKIIPAYYHLFQPIEILSPVPYSTITKIAERIDEYPGVTWQSKPVRNYVETGSLSHILGYVGDITRDELKVLYNKGYKAGDVIGKAGIEKQYDQNLRGTDGREYRMVDVLGKGVKSEKEEIVPPVMGSNIVLTIDTRMQKIAEKALGDRMGSVVILKPATGEVLALVSWPWYDPNQMSGPASGNAYANMLNDSKTPLIDRAIQSSYPPASTFKTVLTAGIIEEKAFPQDKKVLCTGEISYGDRVFRCWIKKPGHGWLDLAGALEQSCDIYYWTVGRDYLGVERIVEYAKEFGFGKATGIDLPGELDGFIPTPQWKDRRFHEKWVGGDTMNLSIGQGYLLVTPIQVADMMALVVNSGIIYRPHLLKELRDPVSGAILKEVQPEPIIKSRISPETFATLRTDLRRVVTEGTVKFPLSTKVVEVAGKTGTAEVGLVDHWHSWFVSFGPYDQPASEQIVVVVMVEASNPWEWWAPYASNIIYQAIFGNQTYDQAVDTLGLRYLVPKKERQE
ncbi:MAG TPA: penicillin-binding protein 2 [Rectinemataceae bacterium]|nr:penicillin-binding protein 2 [Rectinemataceae bacterium]